MRLLTRIALKKSDWKHKYKRIKRKADPAIPNQPERLIKTGFTSKLSSGNGIGQSLMNTSRVNETQPLNQTLSTRFKIIL